MDCGTRFDMLYNESEQVARREDALENFCFRLVDSLTNNRDHDTSAPAVADLARGDTLQ
jgi:hypothetical protein